MDDMKITSNLPRYAKYFFLLTNVILTLFVIFIGGFIINPLLAAFIITILLKPVCQKLEKVRVPRILSTILSILLFVLAMLTLFSFFGAQLQFIAKDPALSGEGLHHIMKSIQQGVAWIGISLQDQTKLLNDSLKTILSYFPNAFAITLNYLFVITLFFISLFFFLYYRDFFISFIHKIFDGTKEEKISLTLDKIDAAIKNYIVGLFMVIIIVAFLNSLGLLILGIKHAIFFGILAAFLTIIPFIGILIGSLIPALFAFLTFDSIWYPLIVIMIFSFVQFLEGNFITPNIVGSKENINPYFAILGLVMGGMLLGPMGIILAIPLLGILKIICDDITSLKPIGFIMGNPPKRKKK